MPIRWMTETDARAFLAAQTEGRLATCDNAGQPYITPLNFLYRDGKIYFHCKQTGRKLDNIAQNPLVCFEASTVEKLTVSPERPCVSATRYTSVLAFGTARVIVGDAEKAALLTLLVERYAEGQPVQRVTEKEAAGVAVIEIEIDKISGKRNVDPE